MKRVGVLRFPGTNCDRDVFVGLQDLGLKPEWIWYASEFDPSGWQALILPGGFSYGDYLRSGALAARAPAMTSVRAAIESGTRVLGICNGFQVLCEAHLLPGALVRNAGGRFIDDWVELEPVRQRGPFGLPGRQGKPLAIPIAHADGRYLVDSETERKLCDQGQVWLRYKNNPNGSVGNIAGIVSACGRIAGLMPHPERALHEWMGSTDGRVLLESFLGSEV